MWLMLALALQFTSFADRQQPTVLLEGNWQSCIEADGGYGERIYDAYDVAHRPLFEFHMGPFHDFALFRDIVEEHREHDAPGELLHPATVPVENGQGAHRWRALGYQFTVTLAGGSREECESWFVRVEKYPDVGKR